MPFYPPAKKKSPERLDAKKEENLFERFFDKWKEHKTLHQGQEEILDAFFIQNKKYLFERIGRKGTKTTTNILIAWGYSLLIPKCTTFIILPTITQAIEIYWDEKRLQHADLDDPILHDMFVAEANNNKHMIRFINGSQIKLVGTWSEARGRGTQPNLMIFDEVQDCSADYLDAMEPNLAAKPDSRCVMAGTPPKKKNHYHEWEERIRKNPEGFCVHHSSYINTALPHLKAWLDNKRDELIQAGKEDVWLREYMAEDCFRSDDRILPNVQPMDAEEMMRFLRKTDATAFTPFLTIFLNQNLMCCTYGVILESRYTGNQFWILKMKSQKELWSASFTQIYSNIQKEMDALGSIFKKPWRKIIYDETNSFQDVIFDVQQCRTDFKWKYRGFPLLKEMIINGTITISTEASDFAYEAQDLLKEDDVLDFPHACSMAILANEYYQNPTLKKSEQENWDKLKPLREAGIICNPPIRKGKLFFQKGWN